MLAVFNMVVSWICKKQSSVAVSQVAAELWGIGQLLSEVGLKMKIPYKLSVSDHQVNRGRKHVWVREAHSHKIQTHQGPA